MNKITAVILAGGKGSRMNGTRPKVLMDVDGKPMITRIVDSLQTVDLKGILVVVGALHQEISQVLPSNIQYAMQTEPRGTLDAFRSSLPYLTDDDIALVVPSDIPYFSANRVEEILTFFFENEGKAVVVAMEVKEPYGYGRVTTRNNRLVIIEEKEATEAEKAIRTINTGVYVFPIKLVRPLVDQVTSNNRAGEFYLTDLVYLLANENKIIPIYYHEDYTLKGVNDQAALASLIEESKNKR